MERTGIQRYLYNIWPSIYRTINGALYFILITLRNLVKQMINQAFRRNG